MDASDRASEDFLKTCSTPVHAISCMGIQFMWFRVSFWFCFFGGSRRSRWCARIYKVIGHYVPRRARRLFRESDKRRSCSALLFVACCMCDLLLYNIKHLYIAHHSGVRYRHSDLERPRAHSFPHIISLVFYMFCNVNIYCTLKSTHEKNFGARGREISTLVKGEERFDAWWSFGFWIH